MILQKNLKVILFYILLAEVPGVVRGEKNSEKNYRILFSL